MAEQNLVRVRGAIKAKLTIFEKFLSDLKTQEIPQRQFIELKLRLSKIELLYNDFEEIQNKIEEMNIDNETDEERAAIRDEFYKKYFELLSDAELLITSQHDNESVDDRHSISSRSSVHSDTFMVNNIKLPQIDLPKFDGSFTKWRQFSDAFKTIIHNNPNLSKCHKLCYLKASLIGAAAEKIRSYETTDANYDIAWKVLNDKFDDKRRIIYTHVRKILSIKEISKLSADQLNYFIDEINSQMQCLKALDRPVSQWDEIIISILMSKLDSTTNTNWEAHVSDKFEKDYLPTYDDFIEFLNKTQAILEANQINCFKTKQNYQSSKSETFKPIKSFNTSTVAASLCCLNCKGSHFIQNCNEFLKLSQIEKFNRVKLLRLCTNCLKKGHGTLTCQSTSCKYCHKRHHSLLHIDQQEKPTPVDNETRKKEENQIVNASCAAVSTTSEVLLATAQVNAFDSNGKCITLRAILDSASQTCFISERACNLLKLEKQPSKLKVIGITQNTSNVSFTANLTIQSKYNNFSANLNCGVLPKVSPVLPNVKVSIPEINIPKNIKLADPSFHHPSEVDLLIGATLYWKLMCVGKICNENGLTFYKTLLGWVATGEVYHQSSLHKTALISLNSLNRDLQQLWKVDEVMTSNPILKKEEQFCEDHFMATTTRSSDGRFIVKYPFAANPDDIGDTLNIAKSRFLSLEKRLTENKNLKEKYVDDINDYFLSDHLEESHFQENSIYIPHLAVLKEERLTTKCRVVFDASCKSDGGVSLNDIQYIGRQFQDDLFSIITRFRTHQYVLTADIQKMYRQIYIHESQQKYQSILWRENCHDELKSYKLKRLTFGMAAAPFLATRCLYELAKINEKDYPIECKILKEDFYMDDCVTGSSSVENLSKIQLNLTQILQQAGFTLTKFKSNVPALHKSTNENSTHLTMETNKALGVCWNPASDQIFYSITNIKNNVKITKRSILSMTAQLFDPMGLLSPIIIIAKIIIQEIWKLNLDWDESIPTDLNARWRQFKDGLNHVQSIKIPRFALISNAINIELHGFSDASERAYGACIYVTSIDNNGNFESILIAAKSRVSPIKVQTIPRMELLAAVLLTDLMNSIKITLKLNIAKENYWTDSSIVLNWLSSHPDKWTTFVANRVAHIQRESDVQRWNHVSSSDNPADIISRGANPLVLQNSQLWWKGPQWLKHYETQMKNKWDTNEKLPEEKSKKIVSFIVSTPIDSTWMSRYSKYNTLLRITAWMIRFTKNCKIKSNEKLKGPLTVKEIEIATLNIIKIIQIQQFPQEYMKLKNKNTIESASKILSLTPFMEEDGVIRVGGRIKNSEFNYDKKHPMLLPKDNHVTNIIILHYHETLSHAGPTLLLSSVREKFWPLAGRNLVKKIVRNCVKCTRYNSKSINPIMGNLPIDRIKPSLPFSTTGVDFAGPVILRDKLGRGSKTSKAYISVFVCFSVKAIHLELVTSLSTESFIAALRRFIARRGKPEKIFSDNGTNFIGTNNKLIELQEALKGSNEEIQRILIDQGIDWHFIPARGPHFGGLWEAGVRRVKYHLNRVLSESRLTYEEYSTVLTQIEAILNSRPLCPLSSDPNDLQALTPAHFLIGRTYNTIADPDLSHINMNRLDRFQYIQRLQQHFWKRWNLEYISEMQQRVKWKEMVPNIQLNDVVLLKEDNMPPASWMLGRVIKLFPSKSDSSVRVVEVQCASGVYKRPVVKLCLLPVKN